jgi:hypothetical protein
MRLPRVRLSVLNFRRLAIVSGLVVSGCFMLRAVAQPPPTKSPPSAGGTASSSHKGDEWLDPPPPGPHPPDSFHEVPREDWFEVVASRAHVPVVRDLKNRSFVRLTKDQATWFTGPYYRCPAGKAPYLVRAVYGHGGTGHYTLVQFGRRLFVSHGSLGPEHAAHKSAIVVNLEFEPEAVYTAVSVAK